MEEIKDKARKRKRGKEKRHVTMVGEETAVADDSSNRESSNEGMAMVVVRICFSSVFFKNLWVF